MNNETLYTGTTFEQKQQRHVEWLATVKAGDKVAYYNDYAGKPRIREVVRLTKTLIIIGIGKNLNNELLEARIDRKTGRQVGCDRWQHAQIMELTDQLKAEALLFRASEYAKTLVSKIIIPKDQAGLDAFILAIVKYTKE